MRTRKAEAEVIRTRKWKLANPAKVKAQTRRYYLKHRDEMLAYSQAWQKTNPEKYRARHTRWRKENRDHLRNYWAKYNTEPTKRTKHHECVKKWKKRNPHKVAASLNARRARKRLLTVGDLTDIARIYARCLELRQWFDVSVDHIIPLAKGGTHEASNLQIIYGFENRRKNTKLDYKPRVVFK